MKVILTAFAVLIVVGLVGSPPSSAQSVKHRDLIEFYSSPSVDPAETFSLGTNENPSMGYQRHRDIIDDHSANVKEQDSTEATHAQGSGGMRRHSEIIDISRDEGYVHRAAFGSRSSSGSLISHSLS